MGVRYLVWRACYELLAMRVRAPDWAFMNYGYAPLGPDQPGPALLPADEPDRLCIQLYEHALSGTDLTGQDVLEVGCGRGGGSSYLSRYRAPNSMTGLDFSRNAIDLCQRSRQASGLTFVRGDAQAMPFPDDSFDAVVNIESSHCYGSVETFLSEVRRVLRPGGQFRFADLRSRERAESLHAQLAGSGLAVVTESDITANVLAALRLDNARKLARIDALIPLLFRKPIRTFAGIEGTANYAGFESGSMRYVSAVLTKPA
jgi:SAM-dependent methyltransferase